MDHQRLAEALLAEAEDGGASPDGPRKASLATAHYLAALLDYLQQDDERGELRARIAELESQLENAYATLRNHEAATAADMQQQEKA